MALAITNLLLETTIQLFRVYGREEIKEKINDELIGKNLFSTSFVFREFLRTVINDLWFVYSKVKYELHADSDGKVSLAKLSSFLGEGQGNFSDRSARRLHHIIALILGSFEHTTVPQARLLARLERITEDFLQDFFEFISPDGQFITIECTCSLEEHPANLALLRKGTPFPEMPSFPKGAAQFLEKNKELVQKAEEAMRSSSAKNRDEKLLQFLSRLKNKKTNKFDFLNLLRIDMRGNWCLGDILITLDTPPSPNGAVYTIDRHYDILCPALGKVRYDGYMPQRKQTI